MKKCLLTLSSLLFFCAFVTAQSVKGKVTSSANGEPLVGASVVAKGTTNGAITDLDGNYSLNVPKGATTLVFSFVGHDTKEIAIDGKSQIDVQLSEGGALNEVVVVGYGTQKKSQTTGAISSISSRQLTEMPITSLGQALQGRVAGIDVVQSGSKPGSVPTIRVRGRRSFRASNDPLYVVDGIPLAGGYEDFNPNDVQSMEILKDATATAIYGARGANGVILITTKRGALGANGKKKTTVSYDNYFGQSSVLKQLRLFTGEEFAEYVRESRRGVASGSIYKDVNGNPVPTGVADDYADSKIDVFDANVLAGIKEKRNSQYQDFMLRTGNIQNHSLGVQGGNDRTAFYIAGSYFKDNGVSPGLDYTRMTLRANIDHQINDRIKVGISTFGMFSTRNGANWNPYGFALQQNPLGTPYVYTPGTGTFGSGGTYDKNALIFSPTNDALLTNPLFEIIPGAQIDEQRRYRIFNALYAEAKIVDGLTYRINFGPDFTVQRSGRFVGSMTNQNKGGNNFASVSNNYSFDYTLENILNYTKSFGKHNIGATALHSIQKDRFEQFGASAQGVPVEKQSFYNIGASSLANPGTSNLVEWTINSFMGRVNYDYDNKYLLTATIRRDGSSRFGENVKYGNFPGVALGWNIVNEDFMKGTQKWLDVLKLRVSVGAVGNQAVSPYQTQGLLSRTVYAYGTTAAFGYRPGTIGNPDLQWEASTTKNIGLDFSILKGRVYGSFEVYRVNTTALLLADQLPTSTGFNAVTRNVGETQNQGFEATITTVNVDKGGFKWTSDIAFTKNNEQIISLYNGKVDDVGNKWFIGKPLTAMYDYTKDGIWQLGEEDKAKSYGSRVGQIHVTDRNNDGKITADDRVYIGSEIPDWTGSLTNRFSYKGLDLSIIIYARIGQTILSGFHQNNNQLAGRYQQIKVDYWTPKNPTNEFPQPNKDQEFPVFNQTLIYFDGSFVKIRNINFGYTLPNNLTKKLGIEGLRIFASIQQPKIWSQYMTKYNGVDPEVSESGTTNSGVTPSTKVVTVGLNAKF
ncbi:MAG: TonB-dependent receptor [Saprospiraceae bacterium]|nr:TonB-dependent receptor [Saprospiraceae bacterium]